MRRSLHHAAFAPCVRGIAQFVQGRTGHEALTLRHRNRPTEAEPRYRCVIAIARGRLGPDHRNPAIEAIRSKADPGRLAPQPKESFSVARYLCPSEMKSFVARQGTLPNVEGCADRSKNLFERDSGTEQQRSKRTRRAGASSPCVVAATSAHGDAEPISAFASPQKP